MDKEIEKHKLRRYFDGNYSVSETDALHDSLCNPENRGLLDELASDVWNEAASEQSPFEERKDTSYQEAQQLLKGIKRKKGLFSKRSLYTALSVAASLLIIFSSIYFFRFLTISEPVYATVKTTFGERKYVVLSDGSRIVLNSCSSLQYPTEFSDDIRKIQLRGEAYFEIARNEQKPFYVETGKFDVQVLGTEFNVKAYAEDDLVSVEVKTGTVEVTLPDATLRLGKQEQIQLNTTSGEFNKKKENRQVASWRKGSFSFNRTPIRDVARELERTYHCKITFQEGQEFNNLISGEHDSQSLESILESLSYISGVKYTMHNNEIILYK